MNARALKKKRQLRLRRITNREYREKSESGGVRKVLVRNAEYELIGVEGRLYRIVRGPEGWRAVKASVSSEFGLPVSPVGMNLLREVKAWAKRNLV
jgi:hypothetical protein